MFKLLNKVVLLLLVFLLFTTFVSAGLGSGLDNGLITYYRFNETSGTYVSNAKYPSQSGNVVSGVLGNLGITDYSVNASLGVTINLTNYQSHISSLVSTNLTYNIWVNRIVMGSPTNELFYQLGGNTGVGCQEASDYGVICGLYQQGVGWNTISTGKVNQSSWFMVTVVYDSNTNKVNLYLNSTYVGQTAFTLSDTVSTNDIIWDNSGGGSGGYNLFDEFSIWNRSLNQSEITALKTTFWSESGSAPSGSVVLVSPENGATYNTLSNFTYNVSTSMANCSLWSNMSGSWNINQTQYNINSANNPNNFTIISIPDGSYIWNVKCNDSYWGSINYTFKIDNSNPEITFNLNSSLKIDNSTKVNSYLERLNLSLLFTDNNGLFAMDINITHSNGTNYLYHNQSLSGTSYTFYNSTDISKWALGSYTAIFKVADTHTLQNIDNYVTNPKMDYIEYYTSEGNYFKIYATEATSSKTTKFNDRYDFEFNYAIKKDTRTYKVYSDYPIIPIQESKYKGHLVIWNPIERNGNWIDFEEFDADEVTFRKITDNEYDVTVKFKQNKDTVKFKSIGGLNINTLTATFENTATIDVNIYNSLDNSSIPFIASIDEQEVISVAGDIVRLYNLTSGNHTLRITGTEVVDTNYTININSTYHLFNYSIQEAGLSLGNIYDEITQQLITEPIQIYVEGIDGVYLETNNGKFNVSGVPYGEKLFVFKNDNYTRRAYLRTVTAVEQNNFDVYLLNDLYSSALIVDYIYRATDYERIENGKVKYERYINGTYKTIHEEYTDYAGQIRLSQDSNEQYRISFNHSAYDLKTINLRPIKSEYSITISGALYDFYRNSYEGIIYSITPTIRNLNASGWVNFTFNIHSVANDLEYFGLNLTEHNYTCIPASCTDIIRNSTSGGFTMVQIYLNASGRIGVSWLFKREGFTEQHLNYGWYGVTLIDKALRSTSEFIESLNSETTALTRAIIGTFVVIGLVGTAAQLGVFGLGLAFVAVLGVLIGAAVNFWDWWVAIFLAIFGIGVYAVLGRLE